MVNEATRYDEELVSIPNMVRVSATKYGDSIAIVDDDLSWTFRDVSDHMILATRAMIALGIQPGDRVALCAPNSARWIQAALGILGSGGILVPLNTRFKGPEYAHILNKSGASALITVGSFLGNDYVDIMRAAAPESAALRKVVILDDGEVPDSVTFTELIENNNVSDEAAHARISSVRGDDLSDIMFTSGTTGAPKGVMLKHSQSLQAYGWLSDVFTFTPGDSFAVVPPFFHTFGYKAGWMASLIHGVRIIPMRTFDPLQLLETIERHRVTTILGPPTIFIDTMNHPQRKSFDLSSLRVAVPSAARVPISLIHRLHDDLGFSVVLNAYGLTEATSLVSTCRPEDDPELVASTVGRPADGLEVIIVDDEGRQLPTGESGEIWVRGYTVMTGYWNDPEETAKALTPEGYLRTGDIGELDEQGFLKITDRKKDMFIVGGFNAYPAEIEASLAGMDKIMHAAVVGTPDERMGEVGVAFIVPTPGASLTEQEVIDYARANLANFKVPRRVFIVEDLPRNSSLKVLKDDLREQLRTGTISGHSPA